MLIRPADLTGLAICGSEKLALSLVWDGEEINDHPRAGCPRIPRAGALAMADALEYLEHHCADAITPAMLAARAGLSPSRVTQLVKCIHGSTPRQLILEARLTAASRLLLETALPVAVIALDCGFYDHSDLTTAFREATGTTPTQYRERQASR